MATRTGRVEKRIPREMAVQISRVLSLGPAELIEKATTENVSTHGVRVLVKRALVPQERLLVISLSLGGEELIPARVVYSQPLADGLFGVGLQFEKAQVT
jgi:PilZ domain